MSSIHNNKNNTNMDYNSEGKPCILWSFVARDDVILAEASIEEDKYDNFVAETAKQLCRKKPTPGWEFTSMMPRRGCPMKLKGMKFHIYDHTTEGDFHIWAMGCVYDANTVDTQQVQSFIEKVVGISEMFREHNIDWKYGGGLAAQDQFSPILLQRMQEVAYLGKYAMVNSELNNLRDIMARNIEMILERGDRIESLQERSTKLNEMASVFKKNSKGLKRKMLWQNAKHGLILGTAITAGVAVIVVPPIVAVL
eukprot:CAMPEP_0117028490 /NCGR_PEP_ID=MMETSP0472-20121206/20708_1 /TAXON_ID=693140 ORGANISM="Tiarina fusus, Strain LIS" /NCGR_SAMPLE_ID=MMETSP0472 /ASSEMBLY_ACC=CAM_ASM_000603 /LENGTH=252 /DNA_ID=CAMNT_0004735987 /DNA_START=33 /DNA_END=791 /DNA_ORIENTATION=-